MKIKNKIFRRSIFVTKKIFKGEKFTRDNIRRIRPGFGISPAYYDKLLGKKSPMNLKSGEPVKSNLLIKLRLKKLY